MNSKFGRLLLAVFGLSAVAVADSQHRDDVMVLMYETDRSLKDDPTSSLAFFQERAKSANLQAIVFGEKLTYHGFGDKYQTLKPLLEVADKDKLVILSDARDVVLNVPDDEAFASRVVDNFVETYKKLTADAPNAVVMSAEAQCCVAAMAHAHPSEYFDPITKKRKGRACFSGKPGCLWYDSEHLDEWQGFMQDHAFKSTGEDFSDVYLNAGLMVGYPDDLINLLNVLDIDAFEDDQAVLSGLMYHFPDMIKLDYKQEMFGNNQWPRGLVDGCVFKSQGENMSLIHTQTGTEPLILHTPGKFYDCLDVLIEDLGGKSQQRYLMTPHTDEVADKIDSSVSSISRELTQHDTQQGRRNLGFFSRVFEMVEKIRGKLTYHEAVEEEIEGEIEEEEEVTVTTQETEEEDVVEESNYGYGVTEGHTNYGNGYGVFSNYGVSSSEEATAKSQEIEGSNYGHHGKESYGYGSFVAGNYGQYGYGNYSPNYGLRSRRRRRHRHRTL